MTRRVRVRQIDPPEALGTLVDNGRDEPFGTTDAVDGMLLSRRTRREAFDYYAAGWSNGYVETTEG